MTTIDASPEAVSRAVELADLEAERTALVNEKQNLIMSRAKYKRAGVSAPGSDRLTWVDQRLATLKARKKQLAAQEHDWYTKSITGIASPDPYDAEDMLTRTPEEIVLRVGVATKPEGLASVILSRIRDYGFADIAAVGSKSVHIAVKAITEARGMAAKRNRDLTTQPHYGDTDYTDDEGFTFTAIHFIVKET